jgi:UTP-glucose-1-phosphate uridylyltransferase
MSQVLPPQQLRGYGILETRQEGSHNYLTGINEKPEEKITSPRPVNISKYILGSVLRKYVLDVQPHPKFKESLITDAVTSASKTHKIVVHTISGNYLDTGTPANWLHANEVIASTTQ